MDEKPREAILDFLKESLQKGYFPSQLREMLIDNKIPENDAINLVNFARLSVVPSDVKENGFIPRLLVILSMVLMAIAYTASIFLFRQPESNSSLPLKVIYGFWPLAFPFIANIINFILYRKYFFRCLFTTFIALGLLVLLVIILGVLGL